MLKHSSYNTVLKRNLFSDICYTNFSNELFGNLSDI